MAFGTMSITPTAKNCWRSRRDIIPGMKTEDEFKDEVQALPDVQDSEGS